LDADLARDLPAAQFEQRGAEDAGSVGVLAGLREGSGGVPDDELLQVVRPDTLVPRLTRLQGLIAAARGERAVAERRLREAAEGWRRYVPADNEGDRYVAALADLGRPPVAGLVEPTRELERVLAELDALAAQRV
jgi:hypothetical protein